MKNSAAAVSNQSNVTEHIFSHFYYLVKCVACNKTIENTWLGTGNLFRQIAVCYF